MTPWWPVMVDGRITGYLRTVVVGGKPQIDALCPDGVDGYRLPTRPELAEVVQLPLWEAS